MVLSFHCTSEFVTEAWHEIDIMYAHEFEETLVRADKAVATSPNHI